MIKGAIFDLDGTIVDSMFIWDTIGEEYLLSLGITPKENLAQTFKTFTLTESAKYYREHYGVKLTVKQITDGINNMVAEIYRTKVTLKPGAYDFLKRLHKSGVKMCVATVTDKDIAEDVLNRLNVREYFSKIYTCADIGYGKQNPEIYRQALKYLGTQKKRNGSF